jgi:predicted nuclease of predicted toxin-antitoxin system
VKGILADINVIGPVASLVRQMQTPEWIDLWISLNIEFKQFSDVGLSADSADLEIWQTCQAEELVLVTDNRNRDSEDSLEAAIREHNQPNCLPVFTISNISRFQTSREFAQKVLEDFFDYLLRIDEVRDTGRLYLPLKR